MQFFDGGAFADCPYIQFPHGMGKQRAPATVVSAAAAARAAGASALPTSLPGSTTRAFMSSSSSSATPFAAGRPVASSALVVAPTAKPVPQQQQQQHLPRSAESAEETTARTAKGLSDSLRAAQQTTEVFDSRSLALQSRQRAASTRTGASSNALSIVVSGSGGVAGARESDPGPIVRSPTKEKKSAFTDALLLRSGGAKKSGAGMREGVAGLSATEASLSSSAMVAAVTGDGGVTTSSATAAGPAAAANSRKVVVPFCVSSWQNRKKLVVPVEQRLAQQHDDRTDAEAGMGDAIMDLALAMQQASREVAAELAAKEQAKAEEEERQQAALEAAEAEKARVLLEQKAAELAATTQRRETREQRLERIRLERELREQEKVAKQEQRMRERAAARLNISVEDLEADAELLRTVEEASTRVGVVPSSAPTSTPAAVAPPRSGDVTTQPSVIGGQQPEEDDDEGTTGGRRKPAVRGGIFASAVISNEGIRREMEALAALEANGNATAPSAPQQQQQQQGNDGIHFRGFDENSADEDAADDATGDDFELHNFLPKKKQRL